MNAQRRVAIILALQIEYHHQLLIARRRIQRRRRRGGQIWWTRPWLTPGRRLELGHYNKLMQELRVEDENAFANYVRMPPHLFDELLNRIRPAIQRKDTRLRPALDAGLKLALTLRHLATGDRYQTLQYDFRIGYSTVVRTVQEVCEVIVQELKEEVMPLPRTKEDWKAIAQQFQDRWNVPHALGALDGKHVAIRKPPNSGSVFYNYKGFFSIVLLALVDAEYKFVWIDTGGEGHQSDAQLFGGSDLKASIDDNSINFPDSEPLPNDDKDMLYFILGDDAFPLRTFLMKPYSRRNLDNETLVANYRFSRGRRVVENGFGILANRWRCFLGTLEQGPDIARLLVETGVILHNLLRIRFLGIGNADVDREDEDHNIVPGAWRVDLNVEEIPQPLAPNRDNREGKVMRDYLRAYFNSAAGSVPWQERLAGVNAN